MDAGLYASRKDNKIASADENVMQQQKKQKNLKSL